MIYIVVNCKVTSQVHIPLAGRKTVLKTDVPVLPRLVELV